MTSRLRTRLMLAALTTIASTAAAPAIAANQIVNATSKNTWSPSSVTINAGESVHFSNSNDGTHDLRFNGEAAAVTPLSGSWTYDRTFPTTTIAGFYCTIHAKMTGSVVVQQPPTTSPTGSTTTSPTGSTTTTSPTGTTTTGPAPATIVSFTASPSSLRVSPTGRLRYALLATPLSSGTLTLKSTKKIKIGSTTRYMKLAAKTFTASSTANAKVTFKLSRTQLKALKHVKRLRFIVTATLDGKTYTAKLTLKAPITT